MGKHLDVLSVQEKTVGNGNENIGIQRKTGFKVAFGVKTTQIRLRSIIFGGEEKVRMY